VSILLDAKNLVTSINLAALPLLKTLCQAKLEYQNLLTNDTYQITEPGNRECKIKNERHTTDSAQWREMTNLMLIPNLCQKR